MNRETYPASLSPMTGDVVAGAGAKQTTVVGIQNVPVSDATPDAYDVLEYNPTTAQWEPTAGANTAFVYINGIAASDDPIIYINGDPLLTVNGV